MFCIPSEARRARRRALKSTFASLRLRAEMNLLGLHMYISILTDLGEGVPTRGKSLVGRVATSANYPTVRLCPSVRECFAPHDRDGTVMIHAVEVGSSLGARASCPHLAIKGPPASG